MRSKVSGKRWINYLLLAAQLLLLSVGLEAFVRISIFCPDLIERAIGTTRITHYIRRGVFYWSSFKVSDEGYRLAFYCDLKCGIPPPWLKKYSFEPDLGWVNRTYDPENPLALYDLPDAQSDPLIVFYGDSFIEGWHEKPECTIPSRVQDKLTSTTVLNLGVSGYGMDQIYLRLKKTIASFDRAHIMVGVYNDDLNRCLYHFYNAPKPFFTVNDDRLQPHPLDNVTCLEDWIVRYPPKLKRSFGFLFLKGAIHKLCHLPIFYQNISSSNIHSEPDYQKKEMARLFRLLVREIKSLCAQRKYPLTFVLFPYNLDVVGKHESWHYRQIKAILEEENLQYIDCIDSYHDYLHSKPHLSPETLFNQTGHPRPDLNLVIADQIVEFLHVHYDYSTN